MKKVRPSEPSHPDSRISSNRIVLRQKRLADAWKDYTWEKDPELAYLDAVPPLTIAFNQYLLEYTEQLGYHSSTRNRFAIETKDGEQHIGNCSYYNIDETRGEAELGIMIGNRDYWDKGYGSEAVITLIDYIFRKTSIRRVYLKTLDSNSRAQQCFQKCGFAPYGHRMSNGFSFTLMEIYRDWWQQQQNSTQSSQNI